MIKNYLRTVLRQVIRYRTSSLINITGLGFGLACCIISYVHVKQEFSYDKFHENRDRIYRIVHGNPATDEYWPKAPAPLSPLIKSTIPEVEAITRFSRASFNEKVMVEVNNEYFMEPYFMLADPDFFTIFSLPFSKGEPRSVLSDINSVVITESIAEKLFGDEDPIGKVIRLTDNQLDFQVSGVLRDIPQNSHFRADYLINFENVDRVYGEGRSQQWYAYNYWAYAMLYPTTSKANAEQKIQSLRVELPDANVATAEEIALQPMLDIHFRHNPGNMLPSYNMNYIYVFIVLALAVFVIACMNYINLATMISLRRIKEIGVRKAVGASGKQLVLQFISESIGVALIGVAFAVLIVELFSSPIRLVIGPNFVVDYTDPTLLSFMFGILLLLGILSGSYLAFFVNSFKPASILRGAIGKHRGGFGVQHALIFVQFSISVALIISSFIITRQMRHLLKTDLGFDQSHVINVTLGKEMEPSKLQVLKDQLRQSNHVGNVATSDFIPGSSNFNQTIWWEGQVVPEAMNIIFVDKDFISAMKLELVEGSIEQIEQSTDRQYVLNEAAAKLIGWETSVNKFLSPFGESRKKPVSGVVKDFNFRSLHNVIDPLILVLWPNDRTLSTLSVRLEPGDLQESVSEVQRIYKNVTEGLPFEYSFMDENIQRLYEAEARVSTLIMFLSTIALTFALLGIYSLISFSIENKTREVAIRKVLGITSRNLVLLFSKSYLGLALAASAITLPICWLLLEDWLDEFAYRTTLEPIWSVIAALMLIGSVLLIGALKYASMKNINPAKALKYE